MRIIPSSQLLPNWFRKVFKLLWPHQNRSLFNSGTSDTVRERKKKKKEISPRVVLQSHLCLCFICVLLGVILSVVKDPALLPVSFVPMDLGRERLRCQRCRGASVHDPSAPFHGAWDEKVRTVHDQHPAQVSPCAVSKSAPNTAPFLPAAELQIWLGNTSTCVVFP